jgi:hypothetical protein
MAESSRNNNCEVGDYSKLVGPLNYNVWRIKMTAVLKREGLWSLVVSKCSTAAYPVSVGGVEYTEKKLQEAKQRAQIGLTMSVGDNLLGAINQHEDPADTWGMLKSMFSAGDQQQIQMLTNRLYGMTMREGEDINTYLTDAMDLRNQLKCYGEAIEDKTLINLVLNGLPHSYEMIIQGITYLTNPTFDIVMGKLLTETHRKNLRDQKRGQDEALSVQYQQHRHGGGA